MTTYLNRIQDDYSRLSSGAFFAFSFSWWGVVDLEVQIALAPSVVPSLVAESLNWSRYDLRFSNNQKRPNEGFADTTGAVGTNGRDILVGTGHIQGRTYGTDTQTFYRSTDGITWEVLEDSAFTKGHPIIGISFGKVPKNIYCQ
jgi:hypothetical protein